MPIGPAEEGPPEAEEGGSALMVREGVLDNPRPVAILGFHVDPTLDSGQVGWTDGTVFASRDPFRVEVKGRLAHSAAPESGLDAIRVAAAIVEAVETLRRGDRRPTVSIGTIRGGTHYNLVAGEVRLEGITRALTAGERQSLKANLGALVRRTAEGHGATATLSFLDAGTAPTVNDSRLAVRLRPVLEQAYGKDRVIAVGPQMGSEDFSVYAERVPGFYFRVGVRNEAKGITAMTHTASFDLDEATLPLATRALVQLAWEALASSGPSGQAARGFRRPASFAWARRPLGGTVTHDGATAGSRVSDR
ncbi:MAG TPA: M20/M25/M40 family metallo-hydrolase [Vicinamibacteria bacterium]|jgi:amidohydrolase